MDAPRGSPDAVEPPARRRAPPGPARNATHAGTLPRARTALGVWPGAARAQTTPSSTMASLRASTSSSASPAPSHASSPSTSGASTPTARAAAPPATRRAYQGPVRVAGMARAAPHTDAAAASSAHTTPTTSLGTGARVVGASTSASRSARHAPSRAASAAPTSDALRSRATTPSSSDTAHSTRTSGRARSPTSPTSDVRVAGRRSPHDRAAPVRAPLSPPRHGATARAVPPVPTARVRAEAHATPPHVADVSGSFAHSPAASALGTPAAVHAHPFTPHVATPHTLPHASTPPVRAVHDDVDMADAKHERKLLDLEISNKSLLAINASLESAKVQQAKELRALRQQIFQAQLDRAVDPTEVYGLEASAMPLALAQLLDTTKAHDQESLPVQVARALAEQDAELAALHARCQNTIDTMLDEARSAILTRVDTDVGKSRVLHASELRHDTSTESDAESVASSAPTDDSAARVLAHGASPSASAPAANGVPRAAPVSPGRLFPARVARTSPPLPLEPGTAEAGDISVD